MFSVVEKKYRDRALKKLTVYLTSKNEWTALEWDKLWKALFYCMWMSDKRPVQEELSSNLAALVHRIPTTDLALEFVHSFFRTMHREWHGLDGLRLDKFYSLVRKFVRETVALLCVQHWDEKWVHEFVTIVSTEIVSQLPNGLRLHLADVYLTEMYNAAGQEITTEAFVALLEPFITLLSSEHDKMVFKRVRESVFEDLLTKYKCGPQSETKRDDSQEETDEEEGHEKEAKGFEQVEVAQVQHRIFAIASADETAECNRSALYTLYKKFFATTHIDSFQAAQEEAIKPKKIVDIEKKEKKVKPLARETVKECADVEKAGGENRKKSKKSKKREIENEAEGDAKVKDLVKTEVKQVEVAVNGEKVFKSLTKKTKKQRCGTGVKVEEAISTVSQEATKQELVTVVKSEVVATAIPTGKNKKTQAKTKQEVKEVNEKAVKEEPASSARSKSLENETMEKAVEKEVFVTKSGKKLKRCSSCGGFGKDLVPKDKIRCGHCERTQKVERKKAALASRKRKAESQVHVAQEEQEKTESSKKVTFGKSKVLRHEVSIKRLKASAKRGVVSKDMDDVKSVLKVTTSPPVASKKLRKTKKTSTGTKRKTAAHFF
uniref:Ribosomal RNA processing protein 1 n=1 Tax=Hyaloperonospora arabidopsidis (strain Emoy2) TaxID=559515 RepID=M4BNE3_HYAAE